MRNLKFVHSRPITSWSEYKIDPRYFLLLFLLSFAVAGQVYLGFFQRWDAIFTSLFCSITTELALVRIIYKKWRFPLSAVITGIGVSLLLSSYLLWPYALTATLSIVFKFLIRYKGGHLFNPNNVALVLVLFFLPDYAVSTPKQWTNAYDVMLVILCLGMFVCYMANRHYAAFSFLISFVLFGLVRHYVFGAPLFAALGPLLGASLQLFTFFMITDPKTSPGTRGGQIVYAVAIAMVDAALRVLQFAHPQFYAVFLVSLLVVIPYRWWASRRIEQRTGPQAG
ncbi:MAG: RnfABCDGE type electron transport complex subunit D [Brevibacillus sp.]|nr:RnfABCDGE type electron transport complex subunit D [Brevibacillus sp.]